MTRRESEIEQQDRPDRRPVQLPIDVHDRIRMASAAYDLPMGLIVGLAFDHWDSLQRQHKAPVRRDTPRRRVRA